LGVLAASLAAELVRAQVPASLPFAVGERLSYDTRAARMLSGRAEMWIEGPVDVQGASTIVLRFSFNTRIGPLGVSDATTSWWDPLRMATVRFEKYERRFLDRYSEEVDIDQQSGRWRANDGREGESPSAAPLDELSFIYVIRTLDLTADSTLRLTRHYDPDRSPTTVRFVGRDTVNTALGTFATREVEMRVRDARHYNGEGVIRLSLSDDDCRRPVRIVSTIPGAGTVVMTLASAAPAIAACQPRGEDRVAR
jgi:hypothetical protein